METFFGVAKKAVMGIVFMSKSKKELKVKRKIGASSSLSKRKFFKKSIMVSLPNLIEAQTESYNWFLEKGFQELIDEVNPITDSSGNLEVSISDFYLDACKYPEDIAKEKNISYEAPLKATASLLIKKTGEIREQEIYLGDFPIMTDRGTFIINGVERVVIHQLIRSPGVFFTMEYQKGKKTFGAKIIPNRGAWIEIDTDADGVISVKIDRKRKIAVTSLLRAFGVDDNKMREEFADVNIGDIDYVEETLAKDICKTRGESYKELYRRIRPGDFATEENAKQMIDTMFFDFDKYDFGSVGRYRLNQRLEVNRPDEKENRVLLVDDLILIIKEIIRLNNDPLAQADDIDHLGNRRVRGVGD
ncbi:MAG TPA: hypothetical protein ENJ53_11035 [Phaeodactylibacter sp.]|nr:hypothetical protein [Phaeodactylibacter sp.]